MSSSEEFVEKVPAYKKDFLDDGKTVRLSIQVDLAGVQSAADLVVNVYPDRLHIHAPGKYKLDLPLQVTIQEKPDVLRFIKKKSLLKAEFLVIEDAVNPKQSLRQEAPLSSPASHPRAASEASSTLPHAQVGTGIPSPFTPVSSASSPPDASSAASSQPEGAQALPQRRTATTIQTPPQQPHEAAPQANPWLADHLRPAAASPQRSAPPPNPTPVPTPSSPVQAPRQPPQPRHTTLHPSFNIPPTPTTPQQRPGPSSASPHTPAQAQAAHKPGQHIPGAAPGPHPGARTAAPAPPQPQPTARSQSPSKHHPRAGTAAREGSAPTLAPTREGSAPTLAPTREGSAPTLAPTREGKHTEGPSSNGEGGGGPVDVGLYEYAKATANREAAEEWHRRGSSAMEAGDAQRAVKLFAKAEALWPGHFLADLLAAQALAEQQGPATGTTSPEPSPAPQHPANPQGQTRPPTAATSASHSTANGAPDTEKRPRPAPAAAHAAAGAAGRPAGPPQEPATSAAGRPGGPTQELPTDGAAAPKPAPRAAAAQERPTHKASGAGRGGSGASSSGTGAQPQQPTGGQPRRPQPPQPPPPPPPPNPSPQDPPEGSSSAEDAPSSSAPLGKEGGAAGGSTHGAPKPAPAPAPKVGGRRRPAPRGSGGRPPGAGAGHQAPQHGREAHAKAAPWETDHEENLPLIFRLYDSAVSTVAWLSVNAGPMLLVARVLLWDWIAGAAAWAMFAWFWLMDKGAENSQHALMMILKGLAVALWAMRPVVPYIQPVLPIVLPGLLRIGLSIGYMCFDVLAIVVQAYPMALYFFNRPAADTYVYRMQNDTGFALMVMTVTTLLSLLLAWRFYILSLVYHLWLGPRWWVQLPFALLFHNFITSRYPADLGIIPVLSFVMNGGRKSVLAHCLCMALAVVTGGRVTESYILVGGLLISWRYVWWKALIGSVISVLLWVVFLTNTPKSQRWQGTAGPDGEGAHQYDTSAVDSEFKFGIGPCTVPAGAAGEVLRVLQALDFYEVLDVSRNSDEEGLRRAKKVKSLATHPDKLGSAAGATEAFRRVTEAYEVLADPMKRLKYDQDLSRAAAPRAPPRTGSASGSASGVDDVNLEDLNISDKDLLLEAECEACGKPHLAKFTDIPRIVISGKDLLFEAECEARGKPHLAKFTDIPRTRARNCAVCKTMHPAHHGELWFESRGVLGLGNPRALFCLNQHVYDVSGWAICRGLHRAKFVHYDSHEVPYSFSAETGMPGSAPAPGGAKRGAGGSTKKKGRRK